MFAGNIWLASALTVTAIFSASAVYKAYSDLQEARLVQEHYELVTDIKTLIAQQYNKNPQDITRDEIIANLPNGNWDKVLLLDRQDDSDISNKELVNSDGQMVIDENDKIRLLALKAKLKDTLNTTTVTKSDGKYTFDVGFNRTIKEKDTTISTNLDKAIYYMIQQILYNSDSVTINENFVTTTLNTFTPLNDIYQDMGTVANDTELETKKKEYFKGLIKERLKENKNSQEARLYTLLKDLL